MHPIAEHTLGLVFHPLGSINWFPSKLTYTRSLDSVFAAMIIRRIQVKSCPLFLWITLSITFWNSNFSIDFRPLRVFAQKIGSLLSICFCCIFFYKFAKLLFFLSFYKSYLTILFKIKLNLILNIIFLSFAIGFIISISLYAPIYFIGDGEITTLSLEIINLQTSGDRKDLAVATTLQMVIPLIILLIFHLKSRTFIKWSV